MNYILVYIKTGVPVRCGQKAYHKNRDPESSNDGIVTGWGTNGGGDPVDMYNEGYVTVKKEGDIFSPRHPIADFGMKWQRA